MFYHSAKFLKEYISAINVFHYISVRAIAGMLTVLIQAIICGDWCIAFAQRLFRAKSREHTPENHRVKDNMPTMGGIFILTSICTTTFLWCRLTDPHIWIMLLCLLLFGIIGWWDDRAKILHKKGISERLKFIAQIGAAAVIVVMWQWLCSPDSTIIFPLFKGLQYNLGYPLIILWRIMVIVGTSNAVNLTDGLDGLAIGSLIPNFATFSIIAYLAGHTIFAQYLSIPYAGSSELAIMGAIFVGSSLGFLWYNTYPAQIFMGDVGSLSLGAALGCMALMVRQELLLVISGALFVVETLSVIAQVASFKYCGRRLFRMAPIHHHFELLGWPEAKIVTRFGIITSIMCLLTLMLLKIR